MASASPQKDGRAAVRAVGKATRRRVRTAVALAVGVLVLSGAAVLGGVSSQAPAEVETPAASLSSPERIDRAFKPDSWWNTPLPEDTPLHPAGSEILEYLRTARESGGGCLTLAGAGDSHWGTPLYWTSSSDPTYDVTGVVHERPPELAALRIPHDAEPASNSDGTMSIFDLEKGYVAALTGAEYDGGSQTWTARGATVTYLDSNGLNVKTGRSDDPRNIGSHRGNNGATMAVSWDQVQAGAIRHVLKIAVGPELADRHIFPMVGSDGDYQGRDPAVPPQGLRLRIDASIDLDELDLNPEALIIARALQRYGVYIGDSGGSTALKLENTMAEGRGQLWNVAADDLCGLPFAPQYWDVVAEDYDPTR